MRPDPLPDFVKNSGLWRALSKEPTLVAAMEGLRRTAAALAERTSVVLPSFTDHSIRHMDELWRITDEVLTEGEIDQCNVGEAFVIGASFYVHDLALSLPTNDEGLKELKKTPSYKRSLEKLGDQPDAEALAIQAAAREVHAQHAYDYAVKKLPGLGRHLFETQEIREFWGDLVGTVSASHHWSLHELDEKLGRRGRIPDALGGETDLGFCACVLRIADYAHINWSRARTLERLLRPSVSGESLLHWKAQELISGPKRQADRLAYASVKPVPDVAAWWLFFDMAAGLDREIISVSEYLQSRSASAGRFSLEGVRAVQSPQSFAQAVQPAGFEPIDVRFRSESLGRLVHLLGGESLYGRDHLAPLRELLQNGRDAIALYRVSASMAGLDPEAGRLTVNYDPGSFTVSVSDNGIGMTPTVINQYLLGIAADYWHSAEFQAEFPGVAAKGFRQIGQFGIGFLAVFMWGDEVSVETQRRGGSHLSLTLRGVEKQGALVRGGGTRSGTRVTVKVAERYAARLGTLGESVRARAPMLPFPIEVHGPAERQTIEPDWWRDIPQKELLEFVEQWPITAYGRSEEEWELEGAGLREGLGMIVRPYHMFRARHRRRAVGAVSDWVGEAPETEGAMHRIAAMPGFGQVLVVTHGIAVGIQPIRGLMGIVDLGDLNLDAARETPLGWDVEEFREEMVEALSPALRESIEALEAGGRLPARYKFLESLGKTYGVDVLLDTQLPWISVVDELGRSELVSPSELERRAAERAEVLIGYSVGPWSMSNVPWEHYPEASRDALLLPVRTFERSFGSYDDEEEYTEGPLASHFEAVRYNREVPLHGLLGAELKIIARAWGIEVSDLAEMPWSRHKQSSLCGRLRRPT